MDERKDGIRNVYSTFTGCQFGSPYMDLVYGSKGFVLDPSSLWPAYVELVLLS